MKGRPYNNKLAWGEPTATNQCGETLQQHNLNGRPHNNKLAWGDPTVIDLHRNRPTITKGYPGIPWSSLENPLGKDLCGEPM